MNLSGGNRVLLYCFMAIVKDTYGQMKPSNAVAEVGGEAIFNCSGTTLAPHWLMSRDGTSANRLTIALSCNVDINLQNHYKTEPIGGANNCNLVVFDVTMEQAGTYWCTELSSSYALLTVIDKSPVTSYNDTQDVVVENENVIITCNLHHNGSVAPAPTLQPYFYWTNSVGQNVSSSYYLTTENTAVSQITVVVGRQDITGYTCHVYLKLNATTDTDYASNTPSVSNSVTITPINVMYPPGNLTITDGNCANELEPKNLTCTADASPSAVYKWLNLANNITTSGSVLTITTDGEYECIATNCIRNQTHSNTTAANVTKCQKPISLAWIAIPIYVGLCWLLGILFALHYGKSKRKDIYDKRYPFLTKMLPCHNKDDSDDGNGCNWGWTVLYIVMVTFVGLFAIPVFFFTVQCSKAETKDRYANTSENGENNTAEQLPHVYETLQVSSSELKTADSQKM